MKLDSFDYSLPTGLIADRPLSNRDQCRLLVVDKKSGEISHRKFSDVVDLFQPGDCLVVNNTKVLPARLFGKSADRSFEVVLIGDQSDSSADSCVKWTCLVRPGKKLPKNGVVVFG